MEIVKFLPCMFSRVALVDWIAWCLHWLIDWFKVLCWLATSFEIWKKKRPNQEVVFWSAASFTHWLCSIYGLRPSKDTASFTFPVTNRTVKSLSCIFQLCYRCSRDVTAMPLANPVIFIVRREKLRSLLSELWRLRAWLGTESQLKPVLRFQCFRNWISWLILSRNVLFWTA